MGDTIPHNHDDDGVDRRGRLRRRPLRRPDQRQPRPAFVLHTGDVSQLSKPGEFDTADRIIGRIRTDRIFFVPGGHDVPGDNGRQCLDRYGRKTTGDGWYSFDHGGVHVVGLVNVLNLRPGGLGNLGAARLAWLRNDLARRSASAPTVVFAHVPLWTVYPDWGRGTDDSEQALALLRGFDSVTVLNGHIHQIMQTVEGNVACRTAISTAFPPPAPGTAPSPGPLTVEPARLRSLPGLRTLTYHQRHHPLAVADGPLAAAPAIRIDNFAFTPAELRVATGGKDRRFSPSPALDTNEHYTLTFDRPGSYPCCCSIHPKMTGRVVVA